MQGCDVSILFHSTMFPKLVPLYIMSFGIMCWYYVSGQTFMGNLQQKSDSDVNNRYMCYCITLHNVQ